MKAQAFRHSCFPIAWLILLIAGSSVLSADPPVERATTRVSIVDGKWQLNGEVACRGAKAEGLLMNVRMVNATFEDTNEKTRPKEFDAEANTDKFIERIPTYVASGVRAFTLCLQGGHCGYEGAVNSAFTSDGSLRESYLRRVRRVIEACDRHGAVVILGCYYQRQDQILKDEDAVRAGVVNVVRWIKECAFTNVVLEIANEFAHAGFDHRMLKSSQGEAELIALAKQAAPDLLVSTSGMGSGRLPDEVAQAADFLLIHFNSTKLEDVLERIAALKKYGKPIVCNEDDKVGAEAVKAAELCVAGGASWGFMHSAVNQYFPKLSFHGAADDPLVYAALTRLTTASAAQAPKDVRAPHRHGLPGQIVVDPCNASWLVYNRDTDANGKLDPCYLGGPGGPEGFLYRGTRNADGTRAGDQQSILDAIRGTGANCIYLMAVRTHGGDSKHDPTHNPFVDSDPARGLDEDLLNQWEEWFTRMDRQGIVIYFFLYDDNARVWNTGDAVGPAERSFIQGLVNKFEHHKHLIWCIAEEYEEAYGKNPNRIKNIAAEIRAADDHAHVIAVHHMGGDNTMNFPDDPHIDQFAQQAKSATPEQLHADVLTAFKDAAGRFHVNMSENWNNRIDDHALDLVNGRRDRARQRNWAAGMAGASFMVVGAWESGVGAPPPAAWLQDWGRQVRFFEATNFNEMLPRDELWFGGTQYVLAKPGHSYIAYASVLTGDIGLKAMTAGNYDFKWLDCATGSTAVQTGISVGAGDHSWKKPAEIGKELAVYIRRTSPAPQYFPPPDSAGGWRTLEEAEDVRRVAGMDKKKLDEAFEVIKGSTKNGGLLVLRNGWLVYEDYFGRGHREATPNLASCGKSFTSIAVGILMAERPELFPAGLDQKVFTPAYFPAEAFPLSDLRKKDIKLGQLLAFTAGIRGNNPSYVNGKATTIDPVGPDGWQAKVEAFALGKQDGVFGKTPFSTATLWCDPGEGYSYASSSIHLASIMLRHVADMELQAYVDKHLARPLGWGRWGYGYKQAPEVTHTPGGGIALRATDMLRFGYLLLNEGRWNDEQVVPAEYVRLCRRKSPYNPHYPYSLQFNVNTDGDIPELPRDAYWKSGSGGHALYVVPSLDLVVWKLGGRDEQYSPGNTGLPISPAPQEQVDARRGWKEAVEKELALRKTLQRVIESISERDPKRG